MKDIRPEIWLSGDESGGFDFTDRPDDRYFLIVTVAVRGDSLRGRLDDLGAELRSVTGDASIGLPFHATEDSYSTRDRVFELLSSYDLAIDATILDKSTVPEELRRRRKRHLLYGLLWYQHIIHVVPGMFSDEMRLGSPGFANKVTLTIAELGAYSRKAAVRHAIVQASIFGYIPALVAVIGPDGTGFTEANLPAIPAFRWFVEAAEDERLLQVADYCAWAIQRSLNRCDDRAYREIRRYIRSERFVSVRRRLVPQPVMDAADNGFPLDYMTGEIGNYEVTSTYCVGPGDSYQALLAARECLRDGDYHRSVGYLESISPAVLHEGRLSEFIFDVLAMVTHAVMDRPELGVRAASVQERWARYWRRVHPDDDRPLLLLAEAVYNRAIAVERMGDLPGSIRLYSSVIREFEGFRNSLVGTLVGSVVAKALVNKGNNLGHLGDWEAGFKCHKRAIVLYGKKIDPWFDEPLEKAFASVIGEYTSRRQDRSLAAVRRLASRRRHRRQVREWSPQNKGGG